MKKTFDLIEYRPNKQVVYRLDQTNKFIRLINIFCQTYNIIHDWIYPIRSGDNDSMFLNISKNLETYNLLNLKC